MEFIGKRSLPVRIYPLQCKDQAVELLKRLNIGGYCSLCARATTSKVDLCSSCKQLFSGARHTDRSGYISELCVYCGDEFPVYLERAGGKSAHMCAHAASTTPTQSTAADCHCAQGITYASSISDIVAPYRYAHPIDGLIKRLKYRQDRQLARVLGRLLGDAVTQRVKSVLPELIVPMPLHPARHRLRGFNQAQDIAHWAGKQLSVPVASQFVSRVVDTQPLAGLNRQERQNRILGAFRAHDALFGRRVAIVDDVLTTGASVRELAREIYDSGAESVEVWVLARTSSLRSVR